MNMNEGSTLINILSLGVCVVSLVRVVQLSKELIKKITYNTDNEESVQKNLQIR